jgi:ribosomal protein S18 acetylase RimI-like enzyme
MAAEFKRADESEVATLLTLMREFYAHENLTFDEGWARRALLGILQNEAHGQVFLIYQQGELVGYTVLTLGYSLEFHGVDAFVDELYLREPARGRGLGRAALEFLAGTCRALGVKALHLEVEHQNTRAQAVYRQFGFQNHERHLLTKWLV